MISFAPIWANELLVNLIKALIWLSLGVFIITFISLVNRLIRLKFSKDHQCNISFRVLISGLLISSLVLGVFYFPQKVMGNFILDEIWLKEVSFDSREDGIKITEKDKLDELREIFSGYTCRRSLSNSKSMRPGDISLTMFGNDKGNPKYFHVVIKPDSSYRYIAGNTHFVYMINGGEGLYNQVSSYIKR